MIFYCHFHQKLGRILKFNVVFLLKIMIMINKTSSLIETSDSQKCPCYLIHEISRQKYLKVVLQNYQQRLFEEFSKPRELYDHASTQQIQGGQFIQLYTTKEYLYEYNTFSKIKDNIRPIILSRFERDHIYPMHFHGSFFYFHFRYFKEHQKYRIMGKLRQPDTSTKTNDEQNLRTKEQTPYSKKQVKLNPSESQKPNPQYSKLEQQLEKCHQSFFHNQGSFTILDKINKDLSLIIKNLGDSNHSNIDISTCLSTIRKSIIKKKERLQENAFKKRVNQQNISGISKKKKDFNRSFMNHQFFEDSDVDLGAFQENYGLEYIRKKASTVQKRKKNFPGDMKEELRQQQKFVRIEKQCPQTPKPRAKNYFQNSPKHFQGFSSNKKVRKKDEKKKGQSKQKTKKQMKKLVSKPKLQSRKQ